MFYMKYYMEELNTYFKQFNISIKTFIIVTGRDIYVFERQTHKNSIFYNEI